MNSLSKFLIIYLLPLGINSSIAQTISSTAAHNIQTTNTQKIVEVYGPHFFDGKQTLLQHFHRLLNQRIEYKNTPQTTDEKYPLLSQVPLMNKHKEVNADRGYDPSTFNPLRYALDFFSKKTQIYRIDDSDYLIIIKPQ